MLLVHANPFQRVTPVPAYGLERIRAAGEGVAGEIRILDPYLVADDPIAAATAAAEELRPDVIGLGIRVVDDCIVVDPLAAESEREFDVTWFMPEIAELRHALSAAAPAALVVAGGAAFSAMPGPCLEYLAVDWGVVGAGEEPFRLLVERVGAGETLDGIPGLVRRGEVAAAVYGLPASQPTRREPLYAPVNAFPVRTRSGCAMRCAYCLTANMRRSHANGDLEAVLAEIEEIARESAARGIEPANVFFADDELNLPDEAHALALLRALRDAGLGRRIRWRAYFNPVPFSDELAALVVETNGQASITVDSAADAVLARTQKPFRRRHLEATLETLRRHGVKADLGLIFGLPGETEATVAETVEFVRSLPSEVEVVYSAGARVYPDTPLAAIAAAEPEHVLGRAGGDFFEPAVYCSPAPPRSLARRLDEAFAGLSHVEGVGVGYGSGRTTMADGYRAVLAGRSRRRWRAALAAAATPGDFQRGPAEAIGALAQLAIWHGRFDLAAAAFGRLLWQRELPAGMTRLRVAVAGAGCALIGAVHGLRRRRGRDDTGPELAAAEAV